ncbi:MAG: 3-hydroxyacyl-ACP dehydratase FabZ family protein [Phycisphaerae bacterium]
MPPQLLRDLNHVDLTKVLVPRAGIEKIIPQRFEMAMLDAIVIDDHDLIIGYKDVTLDDFWVRGHIPGRPIMPGVMMIECAAQLCAFFTMRRRPEMGFMGFAKCEHTRFRGVVVPPNRLYMVAKMTELTHRRAVGDCQGFCNGAMVFESTITGMPV